MENYLQYNHNKTVFVTSGVGAFRSNLVTKLLELIHLLLF